MSINQLSHETIEELCGALEKVPTLNWKVLMRSKSFSRIYKEEDVPLIGNSTVLIDDMIHRQITLQRLLDGLKEIENNKAVSIIMKGGQKTGVNVQYSGGRPPPELYIDRNQKYDEVKKYSTFSCQQRREQSETLRFPIQEECRKGADHGSDFEFDYSLNIVKYVISAIFPCFQAYFLYKPSSTEQS